MEFNPYGRVFDPKNTDLRNRLVIHTVTMSDFRDIKDEKNGAIIKFPTHITYYDLVGTKHWKIASVRINAKIPADEFAPKMPDGYVVDKGGAPQRVSSQGRSGGASQGYCPDD